MKALLPADFAPLMDALGPFETRPVLAVAVSGGGDSLALTLLAAHWAHERKGRVVALTVDHGLRANSTAEAVLVGRWLANHGIDHHILPWIGAKPASDIQGAARAARYGLLGDWCQQAGIVHLLLGHHREDQAETVLLRLGRGSGLEGLAAMAPIRPLASVRLLRPLLDVPKEHLLATLRHWDQDWIEDPSNQDPRHARVRLRQLSGSLADEGLTSARLAQTARQLAQAGEAAERLIADALLDAAEINPAGFARVDPRVWGDLPGDVSLRLLVRLLAAFGADAVAPRLERSQALLDRLRHGQGGTLAGCRVVVEADGRALFCREAGRMAPPLCAVPGGDLHWDGRVRLRLPPDAPQGLWIGGLGQGGGGWRGLARHLRRPVPDIPVPVRATVPVLWDDEGVFAVPALGYNRGKDWEKPWMWPDVARPLTGAPRCLV